MFEKYREKKESFIGSNHNSVNFIQQVLYRPLKTSQAIASRRGESGVRKQL